MGPAPLGLPIDGTHFDPRHRRYHGGLDLWRQGCSEWVIDTALAGMLRALPVQVALLPVGNDSRRLDIESAGTIVARAQRIAVQRCPCRVRERRCDTPFEMCVSFDAFADHVLYRQAMKG